MTMHRRFGKVVTWTISALAVVFLLEQGEGVGPSTAKGEEVRVPTIVGPWIHIAGNPDLGELTGENQQPVDFAVWQARDGTWQAWSCIRHTLCGGHTRLFYRWEGPSLTAPNWTPKGIAMRADESLGEDRGGLQAPHVVLEGGRYHMFYGDWNFICRAVGDDGKSFERVVQSSGRTGMFTEGPGVNTRDIMMLKVGDLWHGYYTAYPNDQGAVYVRTTRDFRTWSPSTVVAFGGITGTGRYTAECPHVVERFGSYYLFRTQRYGQNNITSIYRSDDPKMFGINQDDRYLVTRLPVAAPEVVRVDGQDYIVALNLGLDGLRVARLDWVPEPELGEPVFDLDDPAQRAGWTVERGDLPGPFTTSNRSDFDPPQRHFIGTAEVDGRTFDDDRTVVIRSPAFTIDCGLYALYVSGGTGAASLYVEVVDLEDGTELARVTNASDSNTLVPQTVNLSDARGRTAVLRIVDDATGNWGHINFGGLVRADRD